MPAKSTFNRLVAEIDAGRHTFGAASTRRSLAAKPPGPYTVNLAARPRRHVHIDSTPLDVLVLFDDGSARRVDLVAGIDLQRIAASASEAARCSRCTLSCSAG